MPYGVRVQVPSLALKSRGKEGLTLHTCESSSVVELHLAKVDVAGSNPVSRSFKSDLCVQIAFFVELFLHIIYIY